MTLAEILANEELRRQEFPIARDKIFLRMADCPATAWRAISIVEQATAAIRRRFSRRAE
jgi:hypothetical protein